MTAALGFGAPRDVRRRFKALVFAVLLIKRRSPCLAVAVRETKQRYRVVDVKYPLVATPSKAFTATRVKKSRRCLSLVHKMDYVCRYAADVPPGKRWRGSEHPSSSGWLPDEVWTQILLFSTAADVEAPLKFLFISKQLNTIAELLAMHAWREVCHLRFPRAEYATSTPEALQKHSNLPPYLAKRATMARFGADSRPNPFVNLTFPCFL